MQKTFLKLKAFKNTFNKGPKFSWKKFKIEEEITLQPGTYDIDVWENVREVTADNRCNKKEQEYLTIELKEPYMKPEQIKTRPKMTWMMKYPFKSHRECYNG